MPRPKGAKKNSKDGTADRSAFIDVTAEYLEQQKEKDWPDLQPQHRAFAEVYVFNAYDHRAAAKEAGLNPDLGVKLKRVPLIRAYIAHIQKQLFESNIVTKDFVDAKLDDLLDMAMGEIEVACVDAKTSQEFNAKKFHGQLALQVLQEKSRLSGIQTPDGDDDEDDSVEIHFHVNDQKKDVRITRGKKSKS
jgi:hypothetical protein